MLRIVVLCAFFLFPNTILTAQCCNYQLYLRDSYGDGWNGATLEVFVNNLSIGVFSAVNYGNKVTIPVCTGDSMHLVYTAGMYESENSYELLDPSWNIVFQNGPEPASGTVFTAMVNCDQPVIAGNHPCTAIPIDTGQCVIADNTGFQHTGFNPGCSIYNGPDIWFAMVVPASGNLEMETEPGNINDSAIAVWTGNACDSLTILGCDDDGGVGYYSRLTLEGLTPGSTIYIQVFGYAGAQGTFQLCIDEYIPVNLISSELPIVLINTLGQAIEPEIKVEGQMEIKYNGNGNITFVTDSANVYNGKMGIEVRGATSSGYPQKPFNIETRDSMGNNNNVSILGMPEENDWVLISNYGDRSLVRNLLPAKLFGEMGNYSTRFELCEVRVNDIYMGVYLLGEKIKRDKNRVDIAKLNPEDTLGDALTGGYILQQNVWDTNNSFQSNYSPLNHPGLDIHFLYQYPDPVSIHPRQKEYIASFIDSLETALYGNQFADSTLGYRKYLDTKSFIDYFLINELARNTDGFKKSIFYHKDKNSNGGKLKAGPVWDFDWAWKNISACWMFAGFDGSGWAHELNDCGLQDVHSSEWYVRMLQDAAFRNELRCTYEEYRQTIFDTTAIFSYIDSIGLRVQNAQARHFYKWPILGEAVVAPETGPLALTYYAELDSLKGWISTRLNWLDANIPGLCAISGVAENHLDYNLNCYPNPASNYLFIDYTLVSPAEVSVRLYNYLGNTVATANKGTQNAGQHAFHLETGGLPSGMYLLQFEYGGKVISKKINII